MTVIIWSCCCWWWWLWWWLEWCWCWWRPASDKSDPEREDWLREDFFLFPLILWKNIHLYLVQAPIWDLFWPNSFSRIERKRFKRLKTMFLKNWMKKFFLNNWTLFLGLTRKVSQCWTRKFFKFEQKFSQESVKRIRWESFSRIENFQLSSIGKVTFSRID